MATELTPQQILALPLEENDAHASTIGQFLITLTDKAWNEGEDFDGKRPWGNSAWEDPVTIALIKANTVTGKLDEDGYIYSVNYIEVETVMNSVFSFLNNADWSTLKEIEPPKEYFIADFFQFDKGLRDFPLVQTIALTKEEADAELTTNYINIPGSDWDFRIIRLDTV